MQPEQRDTALLWDILQAARRAIEFTQDKTFADYQASPLLQYAVERALEIVGEAANRVTVEFQGTHPEIPWRKVADMGNWLRHAYEKTEDRILWDTIQEGLPALAAAVKRLLASHGSSPR